METPLYTAKEFASLLGISKAALLKMEADGILPVPQKNDGMREYLPHDIPTYLKLLGKPPLLSTKRRQIFLNFKGEPGRRASLPSMRSGSPSSA